jgi:hypothetical protein
MNPGKAKGRQKKAKVPATKAGQDGEFLLLQIVQLWWLAPLDFLAELQYNPARPGVRFPVDIAIRCEKLSQRPTAYILKLLFHFRIHSLTHL